MSEREPEKYYTLSVAAKMAYSLSWIKLWIEILDDPKMGQLSDHLYRRVIEFFLLAGRTGLDGELPDLRSIAWTFRTNEESILIDMQELAKEGLLSESDGVWIVTNFSKRQSAISNAQRVAEHRARKKDVTKRYKDCNDSVTFDSVSESVSNLISSESESSPVGEFTPWLDTFFEITKIPETSYDMQKGSAGIRKMIAAGCTVEDMRTAYGDVKSNYTIISPASLATPTINAMRKRKTSGNNGSSGVTQSQLEAEGWNFNHD